MKTIPSSLAAHYALPWHTIATFLKVVLTDETVLGFNTTNRNVVVSGVTYEPGFNIAALTSTDSLAVDNLELSILPDDANVQAADLYAGRWDNAAFEVFEANYVTPADGINVLKRGNTGKIQFARGMFTLEFLSLSQQLQQTQGVATNKTCRARLGDAKCTKDLTSFTFTGALTAVASRQIFTDSARGEASDYFGEGVIQIASGPNAGYRQKVKAFADGQFTLSLALPFDLEIGDTYTVVAGCRKRHDRTTDNPDGVSDCKDKFDNVPNFQGEPHLPGQDALTKSALSPAQDASTPTLPEEGGE